MGLPFTIEQFLSVFEQYNTTVWPMQVLLNLLGLTAIFLVVRRSSFTDRTVAVILSFFWLWIGVAYHYSFFTSINPAANVFALLNIIQGILFLYIGVARRRMSFEFRLSSYGLAGATLILYALILYPVIGYLLGHVYPKAPSFGLPCPTTIFTLGLLLWTKPGLPKVILLIPVLWSLIGYVAALTLGITEDTGLLVAGVVACSLIVFRDRHDMKAIPKITPAA